MTCCCRLVTILKKRFEKMFAMGPSTLPIENGTVLAEYSRQDAESKLSPVSEKKSKALCDPSKSACQDYDKAMLSLEQSCRKAMQQLEKFTDTLEQKKEEEEAMQERRGGNLFIDFPASQAFPAQAQKGRASCGRSEESKAAGTRAR